MKTIAIFFQKEGKLAPPFDAEIFFEAYKHIAFLLQEKNIRTVFSRGTNSYLKAGKFSSGYEFIGDELQEVSEFTADMVYDKGDQEGFLEVYDEKVLVLNSPKLTEICTNKWRTYEYFGEYCPKTYYISSEEEFRAGLNTFDAEKDLVIKPLDLGGGKGIFIDIPEKLKNIPKSFPLLMQEFIDTSAGIPGITTGMHDLRVVLCNGEIIHSNIRTPGKGDKKANFSQGGSLKVIDPELLPEDLKYIVASIDFDLSLYGERLYSLDFGLSADNEWKLIELNARPGMPSIDTEFSFLHEKLADFFARILHS